MALFSLIVLACILDILLKLYYQEEFACTPIFINSVAKYGSGSNNQKTHSTCSNRGGYVKLDRIVIKLIFLISCAITVYHMCASSRNGFISHKSKAGFLGLLKNHIISKRSTNHHNHLTNLVVFPISPKNLDSFFSSNSDDVSVNMCYEWLRLRSFSVMESRPDISPIRLASAGLYFVPERNLIVCYSCNLEIQVNPDIHPLTYHQMLSPNCRHVHGIDERNIPISRDSSNMDNDISRRFAALNVTPETESRTVLPRDETVTSVTNYHHCNTSPQPAECQTCSQYLNAQSEGQQPTNLQGQTTNRPQEVLWSLGISLDRPRYPAYAILNVRISSFQGWPSSLTQTPRMLALAGFFYAGYGDYVRCFFCGGGLRNWEDGDDPWVEHARWFARCSFLRMNKGEDFVMLVQEQHQAGGLDVSNGELQQIPMPFSKEGENNTKTRSILTKAEEMGFSKETILSAIQRLTATNRRDVSTIKLDEVIDFVLMNNQGDLQEEPRRNSTNKTEEKEPSEVEQQSAQTMDSKHTTGSETMETQSISSSSNGFASNSDVKSSLLEENRQLRRLRECKICLDAEACIALLPCGHLCCCADCASAMRKCPICRKFVRGTVRTYPT